MARRFTFKIQDAGKTVPITVRHGEHLEVEVTGFPADATAALAIAGDGDDDPLIEYGSGGVMTVIPAQLAAKGIIEGKPYAYNIWHGPSTDPTWLFEGTFLLKGSILPLQWLGEGAQPTPAPTAAGAIPDQTYTQNSAITSLNVASDFAGSGITYALAPSSAALPAGLTLSSAGIISGTPTGTNTARTIVVRGTNASGFADSGFSVTVNAAADTTAPTITGPATVNVPENTTAVGTYTANETVTWSLSGVDAARFAITSGGVLAFASAPDYETPTDNGANNVYDVTVRGADAAGNVGTRSVTVTVTDVAEGGGPTTFTASDSQPRLIVDGDSTMENTGFRDFMLWALGDITHIPENYMLAKSGENISGILNGAQAVVAQIVPDETIVLLGPIGANWDPANPSAPYTPSADKLAQLYDTYLDAGAVVVSVPTLPDRNDSTREEKFEALRAVTADYAANRTNFYAADIAGFDPQTMKNDNTHPNSELGGMFLAGRVRDVILPLVTGSRMASAGDVLGSAGEFPGDTATTAPNVSGIQPTGWTYTTTGTGQWSVTRDGNGDLLVVCNNAPDLSQLTLTYSPTVNDATGDIWGSLVEMTIDPASTGFSGIQSSVNAQKGSTNSAVMGTHYPTPIANPPTWPLYAIPKPGSVPSGSTTRALKVSVGCTAGGSVSATLKRARMFKAGNAANALAISGTPATSIANGQSYSFTPTVSGGTSPYAFDLASGTLPPGLSLNTGTGAITGTVTTEGSYTGIALRVTDNVGATATLTPFAIEVTASGVPVNTAAPTLSKTAPVEGDTLTVNVGTWSNSPTSYRYQWRHSGNIQEGQTGSSHVVPVGTAPQTITCQVWATNGAGESAVAETAASDPVTSGAPAVVSAWNSTAPTWTEFGGVQQATYADQARTVSAAATVNGQRNYIGADAISGKKYFEIELTKAANFAGFGDGGVSINSGSITTDRHGKSVGVIYHSAGNTFVGNNLADGQRLCVAVDTAAGLFWVRQGSGAWNDAAGADPATGTGGYSLSALTAPLYPMVQLKNDTTAQAKLHGTADRIAQAVPSGFTVLKS